MTCKEKRIKQLDELKQGISEGKYTLTILSKGSFRPIETFCFESLDDAINKYNELSTHVPSGFLRLQAVFDISVYDYRRH